MYRGGHDIWPTDYIKMQFLLGMLAVTLTTVYGNISNRKHSAPPRSNVVSTVVKSHPIKRA